MAPTKIPTPTTARPRPRARSRREPSPLDQLPAWRDLVPVMAPPPPASSGWAGRPARRPRPGPAACGHAWGRPDARRGRRGDRQDPGHHATDRLAHRDPPRAAVRDPGADLHGQGRRGDGRPGGPARAVRLHGHGDRDVPRLRRQPDPRVRPGARPADRRPGPVPARGRHLPARAPVRVRAGRVSTARRSDPLPGRAGDALQPLQGRGHQPGGLRGAMPTGWRPRPRASRRRRAAGRMRCRSDGRGRRRGRRAPAPSWPGPTPRTSELMAENGCIDFGDQVALALRLVRTSAGSEGRHRRAVPLRARGRVPGHEPRAVRARRHPGRGPPQRHGRRRRRPGDLCVPRAPPWTTSSPSRTGTSGPGPSSCAGTTGRTRRSSTPRTG